MFFPNGMKGNIGLKCDAEGCSTVYLGRRNRDVTDLVMYTVKKVRAQARRRGWTLFGTDDFCPRHVMKEVEFEPCLSGWFPIFKDCGDQ